MKRRRHPAKYWRVLAQGYTGEDRVDVRNAGQFDELVVGDWLHLERMDTRVWSLIIGDHDLHLTILVPADPSKPIDVKVFESRKKLTE